MFDTPAVEGLDSSLALAAGNLWPKKGRPIVVVKGLRKERSSMVYVHLVDKDPSMSTKMKILDLDLCDFAFKGPFK